ncbi:HlyD family secretion protein [Modicisalibacter luteus]|uniref:HlyD family secretion protein n=1 Tax=Modicisalibacter luteus TaxID=453962 RepID=A0ABV7M2B9_9GAMM|nr:HlyD family secretion protein [Halomonas lutea]GHA97305.1 secretion protein [Halomonas lutea]
MTPEQRFARWVRVAIVMFVVLFAYFVVADAYMPVTPQARVLREVTRVAPEVGGQVIDVSVSNNQHVETGDVLFRIDPAPFRIAVEKAELAMEQARRDNAELDASLAEARAGLASARSDAEELRRERQRVERLIQGGSISRQRYDEVVAEARAADAAVEAAEAQVHSLEVQRGESGEDNLRLRQARNALDDARLDLERTTVRAEQAGWVSNLQLAKGDYVTAGSPVLAQVGDAMDIVADFREKSLRHVESEEPAWVALDALPGKIFAAHVISEDAGVLEGQVIADGNLADIPTTDRWVRDAQRLRIHLAFDEEPGFLLPTGARATVQLAPTDHRLAAWFARAQIGLMSWLHHVY